MNYLVYATYRQTPSGFLDKLAKEGLVDKHVNTKTLYTCTDQLLAFCLREICSGNVGAPEIIFSVEHPSTLAFILEMHHLFADIAAEYSLKLGLLHVYTLDGVCVADSFAKDSAERYDMTFSDFWHHIWALYKSFREAIQQPMRLRQR